MIKTWLSWINTVVGGVAIALVLAALMLWITKQGEIPVLTTPHAKSDLPKSGFAYPKAAYDAIGEPFLSLQFAPLSMQLPDLKRFLVYYGKNGRPDADPAHPVMFFSFTGNKTPSSVAPGQRLFILYDKKATPAQFVFSPSNGETHLWIEASTQGNEALVKVAMKGENGEIITQPATYAQFTLPEKEYIRFGGAPWEIGKFRVDGTLLARQKARWYGKDLFFEKHGGQEYNEILEKQRVDFGEGDDAYSAFVGVGDALMWDNDKWKVVKPGKESLGHPLMIVKKIDERLMNLELWDAEGKGKIAINLLKSSESWTPQNIQQTFKFMGARTRSQFVFEINKERVLLSPHDWLLLTDKGWVKLVTPADIDAYVERKVTGPLFVFNGMGRKEDHQIIMGTLFNAARTEATPIEIDVQQSGNAAPNPEKPPEHEEPMHPDGDFDEEHPNIRPNKSPETIIKEKRRELQNSKKDAHLSAIKLLQHEKIT